jgi:hypothetical protein
MSRFELYGGTRCTDCDWYGPECEQRVPQARCFHPDNWTTNMLHGQLFFERPANINWNKKCKWFKANENHKEKS